MKLFVLVVTFIMLVIVANGQALIDKSTKIDTSGKRDLGDVARKLFTGQPKPGGQVEMNKLYFSFLPVSMGLPGGGSSIIAATTMGIYFGDPRDTYLSTVTFAPYYNFNKRYGLPFRSSIWLNHNSWNIQGDTRIMAYPQYTWSLGGGQPENQKFLVNYNYLRLYQSALKRIKPYFYLGAGFDLDSYLDVESDSRNTLSGFSHYPYGTLNDHSFVSSGPTLNLLYDTRKNDFNPLPGTYTNVVYRFNSTLAGSNSNWQSLYIDFRKYISLTTGSQKSMLALWSYYWTTLNSGAPYLSLPAIGMDPYNHSGRGIEQNRYRGKRLIYFEGEYRHDLTANGLLGMVVFGNVNSASQPADNRFKFWNPAGGAGLRIKCNKKSDTNICIDYGISRNYSSVRLGLGEAF